MKTNFKMLHKDLTSQHKDRRRRHKNLTSQHNYLASGGRNMAPYNYISLFSLIIS